MTKFRLVSFPKAGLSLDVRVSEKLVYATPTGLRLNSKGRVLPDGIFLGTVPKGTARAIRKALRSSGLTGRAGTPRQNS
jgi:hypothetical protein